MKPYFQQGDIVLYHGDCREVLPQLSYQFDDVSKFSKISKETVNQSLLLKEPHWLSECEQTLRRLNKRWLPLYRASMSGKMTDEQWNQFVNLQYKLIAEGILTEEELLTGQTTA